MKNNQIQYYSKRAEEYEKIYDLPERQPNLLKIKEFLKEKFTNKEILEIACGTGYWTQYISETGKSIFSTDINNSVLEIAKSKKYSCPVNIETTDIFDLSAVNQSFESGFGGFIWSHILKQEVPRFIDQFLSKIDKGGLVVFIDNTFVEGSSTPISNIDEHGNSYQMRKLRNQETYTVIKNYPTDEEVTKILLDFDI